MKAGGIIATSSTYIPHCMTCDLTGYLNQYIHTYSYIPTHIPYQGKKGFVKTDYCFLISRDWGTSL